MKRLAELIDPRLHASRRLPPKCSRTACAGTSANQSAVGSFTGTMVRFRKQGEQDTAS